MYFFFTCIYVICAYGKKCLCTNNNNLHVCGICLVLVHCHWFWNKVFNFENQYKFMFPNIMSEPSIFKMWLVSNFCTIVTMFCSHRRNTKPSMKRNFVFIVLFYLWLFIWILHSLCTTSDDQRFFPLCFHMVFNNSSLFMSMSNLIKINIHFMTMKRDMLMFFFSYPCWWIGKNNEIVIKWR